MKALHLEKQINYFSLISYELDIYKICLCAKDLYEGKYKFLIINQGSTGLKHLNDSKDFIQYSDDMDDVYKNIEECNSNKKFKILIVLDDIITGMPINKRQLNNWIIY